MKSLVNNKVVKLRAMQTRRNSNSKTLKSSIGLYFIDLNPMMILGINEISNLSPHVTTI